MKNQILAISFYLLYLLAMVKPIMPIMEYYANYDYIATVLCENRDKPYLECNGKCYLQSQIKKNNSHSSHNHNSTIPSIDLKDYPVSPIEEFTYKISSEENNVSSNFYQNNTTSQGVFITLFKPPKYIL
ncbi:hypothetical protein R3X25_07625 [Lutibacter sp. TH_r2]|uniref:hypothetical protein n=1 Tax=Lutibacter sp. TH_r2 TaxID=3082083 RepID=UPI0029529E94|nr:hypothetical protein [Lutibacter sp. TH_r2]MDV7187148.1 hypothetical protein [Lutibacter sp. TH_r2]